MPGGAEVIGVKIGDRKVTGCRVFTEVLNAWVAASSLFGFQLKTGGKVVIYRHLAVLIRSFSSCLSTKRPNTSSPTRLAQPTFNPKRDSPIATLSSAPATWRVNCATSSRGPVSQATNIAMASPTVTTSSAAWDDNCDMFWLLMPVPRPYATFQRSDG